MLLCNPNLIVKSKIRRDLVWNVHHRQLARIEFRSENKKFQRFLCVLSDHHNIPDIGCFEVAQLLTPASFSVVAKCYLA